MNKIDMLSDVLAHDEYINFKQIEHSNLDEQKYKQMVEEHNRKFIKRKLVEYKDYFDHIYDEIDPTIVLDINQRIAILTNEDYNLIIAGAGSGKTTTMVAKIKYLIEKCHVNSNEILAISFARKNVMELDEKLNKQLHLHVETNTFHKLGLTILSENDRRKEIATEGKQYNIFLQYFRTEIFKNKKDLKIFVNFLNCYFNIGSEMEQFDSLEQYHKHICAGLKETLKDKMAEYNDQVINNRTKYRRTIASEYVRSNEELKIANFLYLNGIDYEYEKKYVSHNKEDKSYHPDFTIHQGENSAYIEHFGIHQNGTSTLYSVNDLNKYIHNIDLKQQKHARNGTVLIATYSKYNDGKSLLSHLQEELVNHGFVLKRRSDEEIFQMLVDSNSDSYVYGYIILAMEFISKMKLNEVTISSLEIIQEIEKSGRTKMFIETIKPLFCYYQSYLRDHELIDFEDMIIKAIKIVNKDNFHFPKKYSYLIIDEYQDISPQRFELIRKISNYFSSYVVAVGDDWQSIFGFAGSDVKLFTHFQEAMGYGEVLKITNTYRNAQELIDVAGEFVQKDENNIKKSLHSYKHIQKPIVIYSYDDSQQGMIEKGNAVALAVQDIYKNNPDHSILLIGRYKKDKEKLLYSGLFEIENDRIIFLDYPEAKLTFSTVHQSKGLEYDNVIIINAIDQTYGFPSKVKDDPVFGVFNSNYENYSYAEERRLFYVALTRTKNKVYIIVPKYKPSPFVLELQENVHVEFKDNVIEQYKETIASLTCPVCGSPLYRKYFSDLKQYIYQCSSDNEVCNFKTTELKYKVPVKACPQCDGYIIFKSVASNGSLVLGCSNYSLDKNGCNYIEFKKQ